MHLSFWRAPVYILYYLFLIRKRYNGTRIWELNFGFEAKKSVNLTINLIINYNVSQSFQDFMNRITLPLKGINCVTKY